MSRSASSCTSVSAAGDRVSDSRQRRWRSSEEESDEEAVNDGEAATAAAAAEVAQEQVLVLAPVLARDMGVRCSSVSCCRRLLCHIQLPRVQPELSL